MNGKKIISLTHSEDTDGIGSQAILYRYFRILKKNIPSKLLSSSDSKNEKKKANEMICLRTDYKDYLYYMAAIFAQNYLKLNSEIRKKIEENIEDKSSFLESFNDKWEKISEILIDEYKSKAKNDPFRTIFPKTKENIEKIYETLKDADVLIFTDLGFNPEFKAIFPFIRNFDLKIAYFDHHEHDRETTEFFGNNLEIYDINTQICSSEIVKSFFLPEDPITIEIAGYAHDSDFTLYQKELTDKYQAILACYGYDYSVFDMLVESWSKGDFFSDKIRQKYVDSIKWEHEQSEYIMNNLYKQKIEILSYNNVEFVFGLSEMRPGRTIRIIEKKYQEIFDHNINFDNTELNSDKEPPFILLSLSTIIGTTNIKSNKFNVYNVARNFGGGGHIDRAGFPLPAKYIGRYNGSKIDPHSIKIKELINEIINIIQNISEK